VSPTAKMPIARPGDKKEPSGAAAHASSTVSRTWQNAAQELSVNRTRHFAFGSRKIRRACFCSGVSALAVQKCRHCLQLHRGEFQGRTRTAPFRRVSRVAETPAPRQLAAWIAGRSRPQEDSPPERSSCSSAVGARAHPIAIPTTCTVVLEVPPEGPGSHVFRGCRSLFGRGESGHLPRGGRG
jgi:hypothetical protein